MARILMATWPLWGHVHPFLELARALDRRGHQVAFYCSESARQAIQNEGLTLFPFRNVDAAQFDRTLYSNQRRFSWTRPASLKTQYTRWLLGTVPGQLRDLEPILGSWDPALIVTSEIMWAPFMILREKYGVPVAVCSTLAGCLVPGPQAPVWGLGLAPARTGPQRLRVKIIDAATRIATSELRKQASLLRRQHGLPSLRGAIRDLLGEVPLYLARGAPEFDYRRQDLPASVHYIGPLEWTGERGAPTPLWLRNLKPGKPVVYVSEGTLQEKGPVVLRSAAEGLANLDLQVILATGTNRVPDRLDLGPLAPNVQVEQWVPQYELMRRTSVAITVGGCGTVMSALNAGVPLLVSPVETDQPDNARRVVEIGAGISIPRKQCTPATVRAAVERLLTLPSYRESARRMARVFSGYHGAGEAAELVDALVACRTRSVGV